MKPQLNLTSSRSFPQIAVAACVMIGAVLVPLMVSTAGADVFRLPKQLVMYAIAILAAALLLVFLAIGRGPDFAWNALRRIWGWAAVALLWTLVASWHSANAALSKNALFFVVSVAIVGTAAALSLRCVNVQIVGLAVLLPAVVNTTVLILQALRAWNPWVFEESTPLRYQKNALLGDTNTVGASLLPALIFAAALALSAPSRVARSSYLLIMAGVATGLFLCETRTTIIAAAFATVALAVVRFGRRAVPMVLAVLLVTGSAAIAYQPVRERLFDVADSVSVQRFDVATGGRLAVFATAWEMFKDHPVTGVGPGAFKFEYFPYRIAISSSYHWIPRLANPTGTNFGEVHNDHLQLLAEIGIPGYSSVICLILSVAGISLRPVSEDQRNSSVARLTALPLCVGVLITMISGFPLQRAASVYTIVFLAGFCLAHSTRNEE
jgi:O-antigen ligase